jgi:hypothetical protein
VAAPVSVPQPAEVGQDELRQFRTDFYDCLTARPDALFELLDGLWASVGNRNSDRRARSNSA